MTTPDFPDWQQANVTLNIAAPISDSGALSADRAQVTIADVSKWQSISIQVTATATAIAHYATVGIYWEGAQVGVPSELFTFWVGDQVTPGQLSTVTYWTPCRGDSVAIVAAGLTGRGDKYRIVVTGSTLPAPALDNFTAGTQIGPALYTTGIKSYGAYSTTTAFLGPFNGPSTMLIDMAAAGLSLYIYAELGPPYAPSELQLIANVPIPANTSQFQFNMAGAAMFYKVVNSGGAAISGIIAVVPA